MQRRVVTWLNGLKVCFSVFFELIGMNDVDKF